LSSSFVFVSWYAITPEPTINATTIKYFNQGFDPGVLLCGFKELFLAAWLISANNSSSAGGDSGDVDHPKPVQADQGIPVYVDHPYRLMLTR